MLEMAWILVLIGLFVGLIARNIYYTYTKVSKEGKKFEWSYIITAIVAAVFSAIGIISASEHIIMPEYMVDKAWWALLSMGFVIGIGGNDVLNTILKNSKQIGTKKEAESVEEPEKETEEKSEEKSKEKDEGKDEPGDAT